MINERTIINALILAVSFVLVPFIISSTLTVYYIPVAVFAGMAGLMIAFFFVKDTLAICPLFAANITGSLNFLPLRMQAVHIACIFLILYFVTGYLLVRQKRMNLGRPKYFWPMVVVILILLYHNHSGGIKVAGTGGTEGARPAYLAYLVFAAYFCAINIATPSIEVLSKVPLYSLYIAAVWSIPFVLTTFVPALAPYLYTVTDQVNVGAYLADQGHSQTGGIGRIGLLSSLSYPLQAYLVSRYPLGTWLFPNRWWVLGCSLLCFLLVAMSGYRNNVFSFIILTIAALWCHYSWRGVLASIALLIPVLVFAVAIGDNLLPIPANKLPLMIQRSLSFIPGDWDEEAIESSKASNEFRKGIQDIYIKEYAWQHPLIGSGYNINADEFNNLNEGLQSHRLGGDYNLYKLFIVGKMFHTGWMSVYDAVGIIGATAFVAFAGVELWTLAGWIFGSARDRHSSLFILYVWLFSNIFTGMVSFFTVFGDFAQTFSGLMVDAMALSLIADVRRTRKATPLPRDTQAVSSSTKAMGGRLGHPARS